MAGSEFNAIEGGLVLNERQSAFYVNELKELKGIRAL
jgi:hypothetical protein